MAALNKLKSNPQEAAKATPKAKPVQAVADSHAIEPVPSPAHTLQQALHEAGYQSHSYRERPMSNTMLVLSLVCVYALSMLMFFGSITA
jgi:hypothetical protein